MLTAAALGWPWGVAAVAIAAAVVALVFLLVHPSRRCDEGTEAR